MRSFTIGKKFDVQSNMANMPGPANYDTREKLFATYGGTGSSTG